MAGTIDYIRTLEKRYPNAMKGCNLSLFLGSIYHALGCPADWEDNFLRRWRALSPSAKQRVYDCWYNGGSTIDGAKMAASMVA